MVIATAAVMTAARRIRPPRVRRSPVLANDVRGGRSRAGRDVAGVETWINRICGGSMRRRLLASTAAVVVAAGIPVLAGTPARGGGPCAGTRPVVAHHAGGRRLTPQPAHLPRACGSTTGRPGAESHIVVRRDGSAVYTPAVLPSGFLGTGTAPVPVGDRSQSNASPGALAVTSDGGAHWRVVKPSGITWNPTDHSDYVDPVSGRLFFED